MPQSIFLCFNEKSFLKYSRTEKDSAFISTHAINGLEQELTSFRLKSLTEFYFREKAILLMLNDYYLLTTLLLKTRQQNKKPVLEISKMFFRIIEALTIKLSESINIFHEALIYIFDF